MEEVGGTVELNEGIGVAEGADGPLGSDTVSIPKDRGADSPLPREHPLEFSPVKLVCELRYCRTAVSEFSSLGST
jgi:hypothetical protein